MTGAAAALSTAVPRAVAEAADADFDTLYWPLFVRAFRLAYRMVDDRGEAEDIAAEALARTHLNWRKVGSLPYREAWVLRVAGNLARDAVRRRRRRAERRLQTTPPRGWEDDVLGRVALAAAVSSLPRRQREAITLRYLAGLDDDQIAAALSIASGTVRTHVRRGLEALRAQLHLEADVALDD